jgi:hypothetical protein
MPLSVVAMKAWRSADPLILTKLESMVPGVSRNLNEGMKEISRR